MGSEGGQILTAGPAGPTLPSAPRAPAGPAGPGRPLSPGLPRAPCRRTGEERGGSRVQSGGGRARVPDKRLSGRLRFTAAAERDTYSQSRTSSSTVGTGLSLQGHTGVYASAKSRQAKTAQSKTAESVGKLSDRFSPWLQQHQALPYVHPDQCNPKEKSNRTNSPK